MTTSTIEAGTISGLPCYTSHKKVWALKIKKIHQDSDGQGIVLQFEPDGYPLLALTRSMLEHKPVPEVGMYYVLYRDGYFSFSPADAFEKGYTPIGRDENQFIYESGWPQVHGTPSSVTFRIQSGPMKEYGVNGCQIDDVLRWTKNKIEEFQALASCRENAIAITKLDEALMWLEERKRNRERRGVEGTSKA